MSDGSPEHIRGLDDALRSVLSPKVIEVLRQTRAIEDAQAQFFRALDEAREEAFSPEGDVWSVATGKGENVALAIDDAVLSGKYTLEEVEDLVSDTMIDASGLGLAAGERLEAEFYASQGLGRPGPLTL